MQITSLHYETVDSTSSEVQRLLDAGRQTVPFAVISKAQSSGRGQLGRQWESPDGNLYLSLALPSTGLSGAEISGVPIKIATIIAWWLAVHFHLRVTLKWPNDLLFAGKKLGGVLCEVKSQGKNWAEIVAGIGMNLNVTPNLSGNMDATSLAEILGDQVDVDREAESLLRFFGRHWDSVSVQDAIHDFGQFSIEPGQLMKTTDAEPKFYTPQRLSHEGALELVGVSAVEELQLNSAGHDLRWIYLGEAPRVPLIVADVGNSATKVALYRKARDEFPALQWSWREGDSFGDIADTLWHELASGMEHAVPKPWPIHYISVNPGQAELWRRALSDRFMAIEIPNRPLRYRGVYKVASMGQDRLAFIESWLAKKAGLAVLVSAGTATTIDVVDDKLGHLGGWILPGLLTSAEALDDNAHLLPEINASAFELAGKPLALGHDTMAAISMGLLAMTLGAIDRATHLGLQEFRKSRKTGAKDIPVIVAGGMAEALADASGGKYRVESSSILDGARRFVLGG